MYPATVCNATMRVTIDGGAAAGSHRISWRANWTENQGGIVLVNVIMSPSTPIKRVGQWFSG